MAGALPNGFEGACVLVCAAAKGFGAAPPPPVCWPPVAKGFPAGVVGAPPLPKGFELGAAAGCPKGLAVLFCAGVELANGLGAGWFVWLFVEGAPKGFAG